MGVGCQAVLWLGFWGLDRRKKSVHKFSTQEKKTSSSKVISNSSLVSAKPIKALRHCSSGTIELSVECVDQSDAFLLVDHAISPLKPNSLTSWIARVSYHNAELADTAGIIRLHQLH